MDDHLPEDIQMLVASVREYVESRLEPLWQQVEREDAIPPSVLREMGDLGLFGLSIPEAYGGLGLSYQGYVAVMEELGRTSSAYTNVIGASTGLFGMTVLHAGTEEQKRQVLPRIASAQAIGCFGLTEPGAGSDAAALQMTAVAHDSGYVLNGTKQYVTNAPIADYFVVFAKTDPTAGARGISAFLLERGTPGLLTSPPDEKMGLRGSSTGQVILQDCCVPRAALLGGQEGTGWRAALSTLDSGRVSLAAGAVGLAQKALELSLSYARQRTQFGQPIASFQAIQWMLADTATEIHAARLMVRAAARGLDAGRRISREAAMAKLFASEMAGRAVDRAVQIHGGLGYMKASPVERLYRDARILRIYEGTSEIQRLVIAEDLVKNG